MVEIITGSFSFPGVFFSSFFSFKFVRCLWLFNIRDDLISGGKVLEGRNWQPWVVSLAPKMSVLQLFLLNMVPLRVIERASNFLDSSETVTLPREL